MLRQSSQYRLNHHYCTKIRELSQDLSGMTAKRAIFLTKMGITLAPDALDTIDLMPPLSVHPTSNN
jgi:hypothetical protein